MDLYHFPADLAQFIDEVAGETSSDGTALARGVMALSDSFIGKADWQRGYASDPALRRAYLRYYLPVNLPKIQVPLGAWLASDRRRLARRHLRVLDLGSGPGSALLGLLDLVRKLPGAERPFSVDLVALDQSFETLRDAERLVAFVSATVPDLPITFRALRLDLVSDRSEVFPLAASGGRFDLVIASNVLCEMAEDPARVVDSSCALIAGAATELLSPTGAVVIIEPGSREIARNLHRIRDRLLGTGVLHALAPCLHDLACPALSTERDWCIHDLAWQPPPAVRDVDRRTGLHKSSLKFSYLLLVPAPSEQPPVGRWRVVSDVLEMKGERRVYLCADGRWIVLGQLKRAEGSDAARTFTGLSRGDLIEVSGLEARGPLFRLPPTGSLRKLDPSEPSASDTFADDPLERG